MPIEKRAAISPLFRASHSALHTSRGFTLVELLVVISIIGILVGMSFPLLGIVKKKQYIAHATGEMHQLEAAIESYKSSLGFYPPSNPGNPLTNQLYYELTGMAATSTAGQFKTLDGMETLDKATLDAAFGANKVGGFVNCTRYNADAETASAKNFIGSTKPAQTKTFTSVTLFVSSVNGPDSGYKPMGQQDFNPWRYVSPGVKNPNSYDLWIQLRIGGKTNLICNWTTKAQTDVPMP